MEKSRFIQKGIRHMNLHFTSRRRFPPHLKAARDTWDTLLQRPWSVRDGSMSGPSLHLQSSVIWISIRSTVIEERFVFWITDTDENMISIDQLGYSNVMCILAYYMYNAPSWYCSKKCRIAHSCLAYFCLWMILHHFQLNGTHACEQIMIQQTHRFTYLM